MISVGIATIPGRETSLKRVLDSLVNQVDMMFVVFNGHKVIPKWIDDYDNLQWKLDDNTYGDAMKFYWAESVDGHFMTWDDDLVCNEGVVEKMLTKCIEYGGNPVGLHGKCYKYPVQSYHRDMKERYICLGDVVGDHVVDVIGTGCLIWDTNVLQIQLSNFLTPNMADLYFSKACRVKNIPLRVIEHTKEWLTYLPQEWTIWTRGDRKYETAVINELLSL